MAAFRRGPILCDDSVFNYPTQAKRYQVTAHNMANKLALLSPITGAKAPAAVAEYAKDVELA